GAGGARAGRRAHHDLRRGRADRGRGADEALLRPGRGDPAVMNSLAFLSPGPGAVAKSPMEPGAAAAGAVFEERDGWKVAVSFPGEAQALSSVGFADMSHIWKMEIQGDVAAITGKNLELGKATRAEGAWWCP